MKSFALSMVILANAVGAFYAGMRTEAFIIRTEQNYAFRGCEQVASQVLKDAIIAENKFNMCNEVFRSATKIFEQ